MVRQVFAIVFLVTAMCVVVGEDKDPIKEKLFAAKVAYDKEMRQIRKQATEWLDKREETFRNAGDKKGLDQVREERKAFEEFGELPKYMPTAVQQKQTQAKKKLEAAYAEAVKAYIRAKKDDEAAAVEAAWKELKEGGAIYSPSWIQKSTPWQGIGRRTERLSSALPPTETHDSGSRTSRERSTTSS